MSANRKKRLLKGIAAKGGTHGALVVARLAEVPLFLHFWGVELYGEWMIVAALPMYLSMSDFGFAGAAARQITMLVGKQERSEALSVYQSIFALITGLFGLLILLFLSVLVLLPIDKMLGLSHIDAATFTLIAGLLSLSSALYMHMRLLLGVYNSEGYYSVGVLFTGLSPAISIAMAILAIALNAGPLMVAFLILVTQIIALILMRARLFKFAPWLQLGIYHYKRDIIDSLAKPSIAGMAMPLGQVMTHSGIRLIIGIVLGPAAVVTLVVHRQLARLVVFVSSFVHPFEVELSKIYDVGDMGKFTSLSRETVQILLWALLAVVLVSWLMSAPAFRLWLGGQVMFDAALFGALLVVSFLEGIWHISFSPAIAINQHMGPSKIYALISILLIPLAYIACKVSGLYAIVGLLMALESIMLMAVVHKLLSITGDRFWDWLSHVATFPSKPIKLLLNMRRI